MSLRSKLFSLLLMIALSACSTVNISSKQFIPRDTNKLALLKKTAPTYQVDNIEFTHASGAISRGVFVHKPDAQFTVLYFMGSGLRLDVHGGAMAKPFLDMNANFITYDYHDFGRSEALDTQFGLTELEAETLALYDHVRATTPGKLVVHCHSFGSF